MKALSAHPPTEDEQATGIGCPDCPGVLRVSAIQDHLRFRCRIGHTYSLAELIAAKEERIEGFLWAPVTALTELAALLREASAAGYVAGISEACEERAERALRQVEMLREVIDQNEPTPLTEIRPQVGPRERP